MIIACKQNVGRRLTRDRWCLRIGHSYSSFRMGTNSLSYCSPVTLRSCRTDKNQTACCVGHEIVGKAVRVGKNVKDIKVGDRVGVGAQSDSCGKCKNCKAGMENHCPQTVNTYAGEYKSPKKGKSYGGYATYNRAPGHFVIKIPDGLDSAEAAPSKSLLRECFVVVSYVLTIAVLCGGVTVYSPLKQNGCGPGKRVR